jgi:hypothetical protein
MTPAVPFSGVCCEKRGVSWPGPTSWATFESVLSDEVARAAFESTASILRSHRQSSGRSKEAALAAAIAMEVPQPSPYSAWRPTALRSGEHLLRLAIEA